MGCSSKFDIKIFVDLANKHNVSVGLICKLYQDYIVITEGSGHLWKTPSGYGKIDEMKNRKKFIKKLLLSNQAMLRDSIKNLEYFLIFGKATNIKIMIVQHKYLTNTHFTYCTADKETVLKRLNNLKIKLSPKEMDYIATSVIDLKKKQVKEKTLPDWFLKFN